ncbi:metal ABC transporter permease [Alteribacillus sp. HJP-4]|uniref:metal ABC transporter permease n=1 Tax=Alteribacillus sp. HJP-4 TaxID=2775394 RepID=UPI0035CD3ACF
MFDLTFIERGIIAAIIVGWMAPLVGVLLTVRRSTVISESLSHVTLTGISAGVLLAQAIEFISVNPLYMGFVFALAGSLIIEKLRQVFFSFQELAAPIILSAGVGLSAVIMSASPSGYGEWYDYLFGSIVSVSNSDLTFIIVTGGFVLLLYILFFKEFISVSFDQEFAKVTGVSIKKTNFLFSLLVALIISMSMKVVGILLAGALISLPAAASLKAAKSFKQVLLFSVIAGEMAVLAGVYFSYQYDIATGGMIVVAAMSILLAVIGFKRLTFRSQ